MSYIPCAGPAHLLRYAANYSLNFTKDEDFDQFHQIKEENSESYVGWIIANYSKSILFWAHVEHLSLLFVRIHNH